jgi:hypothetical protein
MTYSGIEFHGKWPEMLRAEVEDLILQYDQRADRPPAEKAPKNETSGKGALLDRPASPTGAASSNDSARKRFSGARTPDHTSDVEGKTPGPWIVQRNPSPTGPLYAVGRMARNGQGALGPILCDSDEALLDKLRRLLSERD